MGKRWIYPVFAALLAAGCAQLPQILNPSPTAPRITRFDATPGAIAPGGSSTLNWSVEGTAPITLTLEPGLGDVTGTTSAVVTPNQTTTYTLTATNAQGSAQAQVTVTVGETALNLSIAGLPAGLEAYVAVTNHANYIRWVRATQSLTGLAPGTYTVAAATVTNSGTTSLSSSTTYVPAPQARRSPSTPGRWGTSPCSTPRPRAASTPPRPTCPTASRAA
ncbi:hypothetical protein [Marinithermus hydrothermalis]|uniref:Uncharacterized protein n=1 Tax=Marinithermus hydrothermalis (strain DSM 14884 / JCM 11576 / T1) TaxID=869210 RepID=F2NRA1_MARHT|nr:hypothetical protein [Marinithermus hydrothermalis]AEB12950.1 hypothetical protein Marky_2230 [Marinithermus hydrothermalis DSM 14884]